MPKTRYMLAAVFAVTLLNILIATVQHVVVPEFFGWWECFGWDVLVTAVIASIVALGIYAIDGLLS